MAMVSAVSDPAQERFRHEVALYRGMDGLVDTLVPFIREGLAADEAVMVALRHAGLRAVRSALGGADARRVRLVDMAEVGRNPACIIPEWRRFLEGARGGQVRGVGEPVWADRRPVELEECHLHEALLNLAFDDGPGWRLMCPYDVDALPGEVIKDAMRTHPVHAPGAPDDIAYAGPDFVTRAFTSSLPEPPSAATTVAFGEEDLAGLRDVVHRLCSVAGLSGDTAEDMVLAAHELATNSVLHGGGCGWLSAWREPGAFVVDVRDSGTIADPLVGRHANNRFAEHGRGVWMANQLCDLVQVRSTPAGAVVRLFAWLPH